MGMDDSAIAAPPVVQRAATMTIPSEYQQASLDFERFMVLARDHAGLATTNMAWNMVVGVLLAFRRRLSVPEALRFAGVLPPMLRAVFVADWDPSEATRPFAGREAMTDEVRSVRPQHNLSPPEAIAAVAQALRRSMDPQALDRVLATLPPEAQAFWCETPPDGAPDARRVADEGPCPPPATAH